MPTPSSDTRPTATGVSVDPGDTLQFRAATLEDAIALAESSLGARVRVVAANRIRRGGIGGFFAADLGVEVTVALDDETMEQALERLVADVASTSDVVGTSGARNAAAVTADPAAAIDERLRFEQRLAAQEEAAAQRSGAPEIEPEPVIITRPDPSTTDAVSLLGSRFDRRDDDPAPSANPVLAEVVAAIVAEAAEKQALAAAAADPAPAPAPPPSSDPSSDPAAEAHPTVDVPTPAAAPADPAPERSGTTPVASPVASDDPMRSSAPHAPSVQPARTTHDEVRQEPPVRIVAPDLAGEPGTRPVYTTPPTMLKVEQIMAELSAITAEPVFGERSRARVARPAGRARIEDSDDVTVDVDARADDSTTGRQQSDPSLGSSSAAENVPKIIPTLPPRPSDVARRASDAAHAARTRFLTNQPPDLLEPTATAAPTLPTLPVATPSRPVVAAATASTVPAPTVSELAADVAAELQNDLAVELADGLGRLLGEQAVTSGIVATPATEGDADVVHVEAIIDDLGPGSDGTDGEPGGPAPSQRQVELAVAATDQLIESLKREDGLKRLSVRVVLRTGDHREVEAEAEWEAS